VTSGAIGGREWSHGSRRHSDGVLGGARAASFTWRSRRYSLAQSVASVSSASVVGSGGRESQKG